MSTYLQMFSQFYYCCTRVTYINYNKKFYMASPEAVVQRCSVKKLVLKPRAEFTGKHQCLSLFNKVAGLQTCNFIKNRLQYRCFPVNFAKFLGTPILKNIYEQLLLYLKCYTSSIVNEVIRTIFFLYIKIFCIKKTHKLCSNILICLKSIIKHTSNFHSDITPRSIKNKQLFV